MDKASSGRTLPRMGLWLLEPTPVHRNERPKKVHTYISIWRLRFAFDQAYGDPDSCHGGIASKANRSTAAKPMTWPTGLRFLCLTKNTESSHPSISFNLSVLLFSTYSEYLLSAFNTVKGVFYLTKPRFFSTYHRY